MLAPAGCQTEGVIADPRSALTAARLYLVAGVLCDEHLDAALRGGVQMVQLRMKHARDDEIVAVALRYAEICARHGVPLVLNDRPDLVERAQADGVHVGQDDMPVERARELVGNDRLVGLSTHAPAEVDAADAGGPDYIGVGPVHATPTKPGRPAVGTQLVSYAAAHARVPFFAIGGIDAGNVAAVTAAGARRIAVVRAITETSDAEGAARALRAGVEQEVRVGAA